jgi:hypothetical protein
MQVKKEKPFKPTDVQLMPERHHDFERAWEVNPELLALTGCTTHDEAFRSFSFTANDTEFYSVRGAVGRITASMLLKHGIRSGDDAKSFLKENNLESLINDRSSLMEKALRKRIPATAFSEFCSVTAEIADLDNDDIIDALGIYMVAGYRNARSSDSPAGMVARGEIRASDLRTLGVKHIGRSRPIGAVLDALICIKAGATKYDAAGLRRLLDFIDNDNMEKFDEPDKVIQLADLLGVDAVMSLRYKKETHRTGTLLNGRVTPDEMGDFLIYADKGALTLLGSGIKGDLIDGAIALYRAGVDPVAAGERLREGADIETILSEHLDLHKSVVNGWL